jgi:hypothetical protein
MLYRMYTFKQEIEHYAPIVTSEGDLKRQDYRILIPYTPENPDRLIKYAIRIAKETSGEVNILRVITVPHQTPLSAGIAFADSARRSFEPLEKMLDKENVPLPCQGLARLHRGNPCHDRGAKDQRACHRF